MSVIKKILRLNRERPGNRDAYRAVILALLILVCMGMTYYAHFILHTGIVFSHFFYVPIVLAGLWWGRRAVWVGVFLGTWLMVIHLLSGSEIHLALNLLRFGMFAVVGIVVGLIREQALKLEEATKLAYSQLNQIFNAAADALLVIDKDFNVLQANETFSLLFGISKDEVTGRKCYDVFRGPRCETPNCALKRILDGEKRLEYDEERESKDGARITCILTAVPLRKADGDLIGIVEDFKDITERNQLYAELEAAKTYTESIIQNFLDTLIVTDMEAKIKTVNPATCRLLGYTEEELIGQPVSIIFAEEEVRQFFRFFRDPRNKEALNMQGTIRNRQFTYKTKDGRLIPMSFNASVMKDEAGNVTGVVAGAKDLTEIKQAEKARLKIEKHFREVIENIFKFVPEGLLVFTDKLNLLRENKTFMDIVREYSAKLNYTEQELMEIIVKQVKDRIVKEDDRGEIRITKKQG